MYTMAYDIHVGDYAVGMLDKVEIHRSVELLADTAVITLPGSEYNAALEVEDKISRGDKVVIKLGYRETGLKEEFRGYIQRIGSDNGSITIECEDDIFLFRKAIADKQMQNVGITELLEYVAQQIDPNIKVDSTYDWKYENFVANGTTGYDVLAKVQEDSGADIYMADNTLHVHPPASQVGDEVYYDFSRNVEKCDLKYMKAENRKIRIVVKGLKPDGSVKEIEVGDPGGDKVEIRCTSSDDASMQARGESELKRRSFTGYDGNITTWLLPFVKPSDSANLHDRDYEYKDGRYYVQAVTTTFSKDGGARTVELGFRLS